MSKCHNQTHRKKAKSELRSLLSLSPVAKLEGQKDEGDPHRGGGSPGWEMARPRHCQLDAGSGGPGCLSVVFVYVNSLLCLSAQSPVARGISQDDLEGFPHSFGEVLLGAKCLHLSKFLCQIPKPNMMELGGGLCGGADSTDINLRQLREGVEDRGAWSAAVHRDTKQQTIANVDKDGEQVERSTTARGKATSTSLWRTKLLFKNITHVIQQSHSAYLSEWFRWGPEARPSRWIRILKENHEDPALSVPLWACPEERPRCQQAAVWKPGRESPPEAESAGTLTLDFPAFRPGRITCLLFGPLEGGTLLSA